MTYIHLAIGVRVNRLNGGASRPMPLAQISQSGIQNNVEALCRLSFATCLTQLQMIPLMN